MRPTRSTSELFSDDDTVLVLVSQSAIATETRELAMPAADHP